MTKTSIFRINLLILLLGPVFLIAQSGDKDFPYYKYENEEVALYRVQSQFEMPEPHRIVEEAREPEPRRRLEALFMPGEKLHIEADPRIQQLIDLHVAQNERIKNVPGYRVQIFSGPSREDAMSAKARLMRNFPGVANYMVYSSPNYRVRVGDFSDREEAVLFMRKLRTYFSGAFLVNDVVLAPRFRFSTPEGESEP